MSLLLKRLLAKRNKFLRKGLHQEADSLQLRISQLIRDNQLYMVQVNNRKHLRSSKRWWEMVDKLTGRVKSVKYLSSIFDVNDTNKHFQAINTNTSYSEPNLLEIPSDCKPTQFHESTVCKAMSKLKRTELALIISCSGYGESIHSNWPQC